MGPNKKAGTLDEKPKSIQEMKQEKRAEKKRLEDEGLLPTYDYPEPRGARADTASRPRKPRTCLNDNPGPNYALFNDLYYIHIFDAPCFSFGIRHSKNKYIPKGMTIRDGDTKVTSLPMDTIHGWRSFDMQSEYQYMYNHTSLSVTKAKKKDSSKDKTRPSDSPDSQIRHNGVY